MISVHLTEDWHLEHKDSNKPERKKIQWLINEMNNSSPEMKYKLPINMKNIQHQRNANQVT